MTAHLRQLTLIAAMLAATAPTAALAEDVDGREAGREARASDVPSDLLSDARVTYGHVFDGSFIRAADDAGQAAGSGRRDIPWVRVLRTERPPARAWPRLGELVRATSSGSPPVFGSFEELLRP